MRVLVTRPQEDARPLVAALAERGHEALVEPMLTVAPAADVAGPPELAGVQALLFTSANGVRAFAGLSEERGLPVFAVGEASAAAARAAGFAPVESAEGDVADLARLVRRRLEPDGGALYHGAASRVAGDLKGDLEAAGFALRRQVLYRATPVAELSEGLRRRLGAGEVDVATFFSPRTAASFASLVECQGLGEACSEVTALALSAAVAEELKAVRWREVLVAERPTQAALLERLDALAAVATLDEAMTQSETPEPGPAAPRSEKPGETGALRVITAFGGIRPMAHKLGVAVSTVQGWRERTAIPARHHGRILAAAREQGIEIDTSDLDGEEGAAAPPKSTVEPEPTAAAPAGDAAPGARGQGAGATAPPAAPPAAAPPRPAESGAWLRGFLVAALVFVVGAGGAVLLRGLWLPWLDGGDGAALAGLERRVAALESAPAAELDAAELEALEQRLGARLDALAQELSGAAAAGDLAALGTRLDQTANRLDDADTRLDDLDARLETLSDLPGRLQAVAQQAEALAALEARVGDLADLGRRVEELAALEGRVAELAAAQQAARDAFTAEAAFTIGVLQLRDALRGSGSFEAELELLRNRAASGRLDGGAALAETLAPLAPHAASGIPSLARLRAGFPEVARAVVTEARAAGAEDWVAGVVRRVSDLVTVRPVGAVGGQDPAAIVARAEADLANDDLAGALAELAALDGAPAAPAAAWRAEAAARLAAQRALTELGRGLLGRLAPKDEGADEAADEASDEASGASAAGSEGG